MTALPTDPELFERWQAGERSAGEQLLRRSYASILRYFELNASWVADDLAQRTFIACIERAQDIRDPEAFRAYLMGIARRQLAMHLRSTLRDDPRLDFEEPHGTRMSTLVARTQNHTLVLRALASLPRDPQLLLLMVYWDELPVVEIARGMAVSASTLRTRLERARKLLRARMQEFSSRPVPADEAHLRALLRSVLADADAGCSSDL